MLKQTTKALFYAWFSLWAMRTCDGLSSISPSKENASQRRLVFLTGATGFVGSRVAHDILEFDPNASLVCLVRSKDSAEAVGRLTDAFNRFGLGDKYDSKRLHAIPGDVVQSNFGLSQPEFVFWAHNADSVVHCAADIGLAKNSEANGSKTIENILSFAQEGGRPCSLHFVSSIAAVALADTDTILESGDYPPSAAFPGGYGEAKHAAETRIKSWAADNLDNPTYIYRAPFIIGPVPQQYTVPDIFFKLIHALGVLPQPRKYLPLCTINHLSKSMAHSVIYGDSVLTKIGHEKGVPKILHTVAEQQTWVEQSDLLRAALPVCRGAEAPFFPELLHLAKQKRASEQICRSSKKACSHTAVAMLGSVLEQDLPYFEAESTWDFLKECNLDRSVAEMTQHDIRVVFEAATATLKEATMDLPAGVIGFTNKSEALVY